MTHHLLIGLLGCALGGVCIYLGSPHQRWLGAAWPARPARGVGGLLWLSSWAALARGMQQPAATFLFVVTVMAVLLLLPYLGAWRSLRRQGSGS
jgi:hypothetical protein